MNVSLRWRLGAVLLVPIILTAARGADLPDVDRADAQRSVRSDGQIEADWLRQDVVRNLPAGANRPSVRPEEDAPGACDGVRNGKYGFHTALQNDPWWQVDLLKPVPLEELLVFNRCDGSQRRALRLQILVSADGNRWDPVYQHDGTLFLGHSDNHPLSVDLAGTRARFLRIQVAGETYLHLDEVEIYQPGGRRNIALRKPATQSSASTWSTKSTMVSVVDEVAKKPAGSSDPTSTLEPAYPIRQVLRRGRLLGESLQKLGANVEDELRTLEEIADRAGATSVSPVLKWKHGQDARGTDQTRTDTALEELAARSGATGVSPVLGATGVSPVLGATGVSPVLRAALQPETVPLDVKRELYFRARWAVREMALANPLLDFDDLLLVKRTPARFTTSPTSRTYTHMCDQYYGWFSRPGGGMYVLEDFRCDHPRLRCLTDGFEPGNIIRPEISYDGRKVLFAYCRHYPHVHGMVDKLDKSKIPEDAFYHLYEMNLDGTGLRRLTRGKYDDFDGRYLPDGEIVFLSTRRGQHIQCGRDSAMATIGTELGDCYVRCGGGPYRPVAVYTLHRMDADG